MAGTGAGISSGVILLNRLVSYGLDREEGHHEKSPHRNVVGLSGRCFG